MSFLIRCPHCGERSAYEFRFGGEVRERPSPGASYDDWIRYTYVKANVAGVQKEWWYHRAGCHQWIVAARNAVTNEVLETSFPEEAP
jgi:heterotetrameric sarcosine oxidase delta subunit